MSKSTETQIVKQVNCESYTAQKVRYFNVLRSNRASKPLRNCLTTRKVVWEEDQSESGARFLCS